MGVWLKDKWLAKLIGPSLFQHFFCSTEPNIMWLGEMGKESTRGPDAIFILAIDFHLIHKKGMYEFLFGKSNITKPEVQGNQMLAPGEVEWVGSLQANSQTICKKKDAAALPNVLPFAS